MKNKLEKILIKAILIVPKNREEIYSFIARVVYHPSMLIFY